MNPLFVYWITANMIMIPLLVLVVAPAFIAHSEKDIDYFYSYVNDEGKKKFDEMREQLPFNFYIMPIVLTNITVAVIFFWKGREPKGSNITCKNALGGIGGSES